MTNDKIREKFLSGTVAIKAQRLKKFERAINKARKDERERVCNEFQEAINEAGLGTFKIWEILANIKLKSLE